MSDHSTEQLRALLTVDRFPRSAKYDPHWVIENEMGPNVLWLAEYLSEVMALQPGMRVLDLGCGKAVSSVFLAREFGVEVWATDLWIPASENAGRIREAGLVDRVFAIHGDARALPFEETFFDAIVSLDAYHYFGTDDLYLPTLLPLLKAEGRIGIVVPGLREEVDELPAAWDWDFCAFHTPAWWRRHWSITRMVEVEVADRMPGGRQLWLHWSDVIDWPHIDYLTGPGGENLGFTRIVARKLAVATGATSSPTR